MSVFASVLNGVGVFAQLVGIAGALRYLKLPVNANLLMASGASLSAFGAKLGGDTITTGICTACAIFQFAMWWNNRGGGGNFRKAARQIGDKGKALVRALVDQLNPAPQPSGAGA